MTTLVVVDDEPLITGFLRLLLEDAGFTVHVASNGKEALDVIARVRPALVVTDLMMPVMSGLDLATALRANFLSLNVILYSATPDAIPPEDRHLFAAMLRKPQSAAVLLQVIEQYT